MCMCLFLFWLTLLTVLYFVVDVVGMVSLFAHGVVFVCCAYAVVHLLQRNLVNVVVYGGIEHFGAYV